ncbi:hypothetical protein ALQ30_200282 [Pseudomonas syringae pv. persicae]|uniref:Uncharacterized protein n=1 Tax=Pseudomonas syringae pv. persicae TaxID=237306 RepID=A0A3M4AT77_9PSED|nr:hypothetical protein ALQ30_200282 [Pseudomonas syringae pv. persicae]
MPFFCEGLMRIGFLCGHWVDTELMIIYLLMGFWVDFRRFRSLPYSCPSASASGAGLPATSQTVQTLLLGFRPFAVQCLKRNDGQRFSAPFKSSIFHITPCVVNLGIPNLAHCCTPSQ